MNKVVDRLIYSGPLGHLEILVRDDLSTENHPVEYYLDGEQVTREEAQEILDRLREEYS